jgi:plastocyanin
MINSTSKVTITLITLMGFLSCFALADEKKEATGAAMSQNRIEIKDFSFSPQTITVKSGQQITWINHDEEPHTVVNVEKQFKKSPPLDTDQVFTITADAPGTYTYFCSVHPKMTGTIIVQKS